MVAYLAVPAQLAAVFNRNPTRPSHQICDVRFEWPPSPGVETGTIHLSPTAPGLPLTARQSSGTYKLPCIAGVPSCGLALAIYLALITIRKLEQRGPDGETRA